MNRKNSAFALSVPTWGTVTPEKILEGLRKKEQK